jgi:hypothetical protein
MYQYPPNFEKDKLNQRTMKVIEYGVIWMYFAVSCFYRFWAR